jgi:hypothetical protein
MAFIAGLIVGILGGSLSWLAAAAWLEVRRHWALQTGATYHELAANSGMRALQQQPSRG